MRRPEHFLLLAFILTEPSFGKEGVYSLMDVGKCAALAEATAVAAWYLPAASRQAIKGVEQVGKAGRALGKFDKAAAERLAGFAQYSKYTEVFSADAIEGIILLAEAAGGAYATKTIGKKVGGKAIALTQEGAHQLMDSVIKPAWNSCVHIARDFAAIPGDIATIIRGDTSCGGRGIDDFVKCQKGCGTSLPLKQKMRVWGYETCVDALERKESEAAAKKVINYIQDKLGEGWREGCLQNFCHSEKNPHIQPPDRIGNCMWKGDTAVFQRIRDEEGPDLCEKALSHPEEIETLLALGDPSLEIRDGDGEAHAAKAQGAEAGQKGGEHSVRYENHGMGRATEGGR